MKWRYMRRHHLKLLRLRTASFWLEELALPGCTLALEAIAVGVWLQLGAAWIVGNAAQALLPSWALLIVLLEALWLARWLAARRLPGVLPGFLIIVGWAFTLLLLWYARLYASSGTLWQPGWLEALISDLQTDSGQIGAVIGITILSAFLWWRGLRLGRIHLEADEVSRSFKSGFAALVLALLLSGTVTAAARTGLTVRLGLALPLLLFVGLAALSLAKLAEIRRRQRERIGPQADPTRSWIIVLLTLSGALVLLTLGTEEIFSFHLWLLLLTSLQPFWDAIAILLGWVALGLAYLAYWVFHPIVEGLRELFGGQQQSLQPPAGSPLPSLPRNGNTGGLPLDWLIAGRYILIAIGLLLLLLILWRAFRLFVFWRRQDFGDEERESLGAMRVMRGQLSALLAALAGRFHRKLATDETEKLAFKSPIRLLYRRLLHQTQACGIQRAPAETPQEFAERLGPGLERSRAAPSGPPASAESIAIEPLPPRLPAPDPGLAALTRAYEEARYGEREPSSSQLVALTEQAEHLLRRLERWRPTTPQHRGVPTMDR